MSRILYVHTTSEVGGSDVSLVRLIEGLDPARYQAVVVLPSEGPLVPRLRDAGAVVHVMPALLKLTSRKGRGYLLRLALNAPRAVRALAALMQREDIDLVHTNTIHNLYGGPAARLAGVPHVWHIREIVWQYGALRALELFMVRRLSTRIIVTSEAVAAMFGAPGARPASLVLVPNGIEVERFHPAAPGAPRPVRAALGVADGQPLVGIVCRLDVWKGVDVFLDAAARIAAARPDVRFVVVGGAITGLEAYARTLETRAHALGLADRVRFTWWAYGPAAMPEVHRALDVLVLASTQPEPFGLVVVEAMATGVPVVATAHGGPAEIVVEGVTGRLVPPRDPDALAAAVCALVDDPAAAARMGAAGRARACALYSAGQYLAGVQAVYADVLGLSIPAGDRG